MISGAGTSGMCELLARRLAETVRPIVADLAVVAEHRLQPCRVAPVGKLVAECRRRRERPAVFGEQECQRIAVRHRIERGL